jgi:hypothetical protein
MNADQIRKEVEKHIGKTIRTLYGPSLVVGIIKDEEGVEYIHLKERGYEDYHVKLVEWETLVQ